MLPSRSVQTIQRAQRREVDELTDRGDHHGSQRRLFPDSDHVRDRIEALRTPTTGMVVLDAETSPFIDISAAEMLAQPAMLLRRDGIELRIAGDVGQFRDAMRSAVPEAFHHGVFRTIDEALSSPPSPPGPPADGAPG